jgi:hypothetical protein
MKDIFFQFVSFLMLAAIVVMSSCSQPLYPTVRNELIIDLIKSAKGKNEDYKQMPVHFENQGTSEYYELVIYMVRKDEEGLLKPKYNRDSIKNETISAHYFRLFIGDIVMRKDDSGNEKEDPSKRLFALVSFRSPKNKPTFTEGSTVVLLGEIENTMDTIRYAKIKQRYIIEKRENQDISKAFTKGRRYDVDLDFRFRENDVFLDHAVDRSSNKISSDYNLYYNVREMYGFQFKLKKMSMAGSLDN